MRQVVWFASIVMALLYCPASAWAYTLTFDDIPAGQDISYYTAEYGVIWASGFEVVDESQFSWSQAHSGTNVLIWNCSHPSWAAGFEFGADPADYPDCSIPPYNVYSVGAYFSTDMGQVLALVGYRKGGSVAATATVGSELESWQDRYVEIFSASGDIAFVHISGVSSPDARYRFCLDHLTVVPVPEPSALLALAGGLGVLGLPFIRRRR